MTFFLFSPTFEVSNVLFHASRVRSRIEAFSLFFFFFNQIGITGLRLRRFFHLLIERLFGNIVFVMSIVPCAIGLSNSNEMYLFERDSPESCKNIRFFPT